MNYQELARLRRREEEDRRRQQSASVSSPHHTLNPSSDFATLSYSSAMSYGDACAPSSYDSSSCSYD